MNQEQFSKVVADILHASAGLLVSKGDEYASDTDRLSNFKRGAEILGMRPLDVWAVYFNKHIDGINSYVKRTKTEHYTDVDAKLSEPIEGRFEDAINYLLLGVALLLEMRNPPDVKQVDSFK